MDDFMHRYIYMCVRCRWALVKDEEVYNRLTRYVMHNTLGVSRDTQLRAMRLLEAVLKGNGRGLFEFGHRTMSKRWQRLSETLAKSRRFSLQKLSPQYCTFFGNVTGPSPGTYLYIIVILTNFLPVNFLISFRC